MLGVLLLGAPPAIHSVRAQGVDPALALDVAAVRARLARSNEALRQYTWTEQTEVLVKGNVKSTAASACRYDLTGKLIKTPLAAADDKKRPSAVSNRPMVRKKAEMQDYIERAVTCIHNYVPPNPEQINYLLQNGHASLETAGRAKSQLRLTHYFRDADSLVFTYDPVSKLLLAVTIASNLGNPKDPVTLEAVFETLPDGVNHLSSATLEARAKKVQVKMRNSDYRKVAER